LGDAVTVNLVYKPFFEVERRKYRFRILNASVARFYKIALSDGSQMIQIANDGNLLPNPVTLTQLDQQGIAERYDIVIDFSRYSSGQTVSMVNLLEHVTGRMPETTLSLSSALAGASPDPGVGRFLEFRIVRDPAEADISQVPAVLIPNPDLSAIPVARERLFEFGRDAFQTSSDPVSASVGEWGIRSEFDAKGKKRADQQTLAADFGRITARTGYGTREIWTLKNGGGAWDHPIHIHFEEGQILSRNGSGSNVQAAERGRKDVYRLRPGGELRITMQFRDFGGMFMQHCHNTVHEDHAMLMRWEIDGNGVPYLTTLPTPIPRPQGVTFQDPTILKNA
ncbi:MAG: multicopper oxidase family protein, partial [Burkholderiales bacterium]